MSFMVQEDVVQLQITVDDALFMQEVQSNADLSSVKPVKGKRMMCLKKKQIQKIKDLSWSGSSS